MELAGKTSGIGCIRTVQETLLTSGLYHYQHHLKSRDDFKKKLEDQSRYNHVVHNSYFSNIHDDVIINFDEKTFMYNFQGTLDGTLSKRINIDHFRYRISIGYHVVVFD